jgi:cytochrome P450
MDRPLGRPPPSREHVVSSLATDSPAVVPSLVPSPRRGDLLHIPGDDGLPIIGNTVGSMADPLGFAQEKTRRYGLVHRTFAFGMHAVSLLGPDGVGLLLFDQTKLFSSTEGWEPFLGLLFPRGLMLLDFDEHRLHRRALSVAFKSGPLKSYLAGLNAGIGERVREWRQGPADFLFYPAIKQLTLDLAGTAFLGEVIGGQTEAVKRAFIDMVAASITIIRRPLPGTPMRRGVKGRAFIIDYFSGQVPVRRERGGDDIFSQLCRATHEDGSLMTPADIAAHMSFLMMAAHDTLSSSLSAFVQFLCFHPDWQQQLREELLGLGLAPGEPLPFERLDELYLTEMAFKEAMRIIPPVVSLPRRAMRGFEFGGYRIPPGTRVNTSIIFTHHMPELWPEPERFDPLRFTEEQSRGRHRFAYAPFGGGAHMCLGLHFAYMQAKCFAYHLLTTSAMSTAPGYRPKWQMTPIPKPRDGLRVTLRALD